VFALPEETQATAAQMRRVVGDQIKALNELAGLVAGAGSHRGVDVLPVQRPAPKAGPELRAVLSPATATVHAAPVPPAAKVSDAEPGRNRSRRDETEAGPRNGVGGDERLSNEARRGPSDKPEPTNANGGALNPLASLTSLSGTIGQMLDPEGAAEAWDRHRRGEPNAFTRRLYTPQGQQMFDEIRRKYRRDPEFKGAVDRYIGEFEGLLAKVARNGRGASESVYLTSDPGKVYTLLGHASSRFEQA
jgi:hypothetical protein